MITLATLAQAAPQEVFDQVATHLLTQGVRSSEGPLCRYRGVGDTKCAIGCLVSDAEYRDWFHFYEGSGIATIADKDSRADTDHEQMLIELQSMHDSVDPADWSRELRKVAARNNVNSIAIEAWI